MLGRYDRAMRARGPVGRLTLLQQAIAAIKRNNGALFYVPQNALGDGAPNLLSVPEDFSDAAWSKDPGGGITANTDVAPDGTLTADTLTVTTSHALRQPISKSAANVAYTGSVWVMRKSGGGDLAIRFVANGSVISGSVVLPTLPLGVWTRVTNTANSGAFADLRFDLTSGVAGTYAIWGAKLEQGSTATAYTPQSVLRTSGVFIDSAGVSPVTKIADVIGRMTDRTGGSAVATQATTANKPTVQTNAQGRYVVRFDGSNDSLNTNITTGNEGWVCAGVVATDSNATVVCSGAGSASQKGIWMYRTSADDRINCMIGNGTSTINASAPSVQWAANTSVVVEALWYADAISVGVNGTYGATTTRAGNASPSPTLLRIGAYTDGVTYPLAGEMAALVYCPVAPSAADRAIIRKWIGSLHGQTL